MDSAARASGTAGRRASFPHEPSPTAIPTMKSAVDAAFISKNARRKTFVERPPGGLPTPGVVGPPPLGTWFRFFPLHRLQNEARDPQGEIDTGLALNAQRLKDDRVFRAAHKCVSASTNAHGCIGGNTRVIPRERAGWNLSCRSQDSPDEDGRTLDAENQPE